MMARVTQPARPTHGQLSGASDPSEKGWLAVPRLFKGARLKGEEVPWRLFRAVTVPKDAGTRVLALR